MGPDIPETAAWAWGFCVRSVAAAGIACPPATGGGTPWKPGRVTKLVQFGAFVQVGDGIEGLVHISEMSTHHVESPEQVVTPGEELWVKIIDLDLQRRRISLSIKQAVEGGELAAEYREHFEVDEEGNWASSSDEVEAAWAEFESADAGEAGAEAPAEAAEPSEA